MRPIDETWLSSPMRHVESLSGTASPIVVPDADRFPCHTSDEELPLDPRHILVSVLLPIGDTLFATPALAALRRRFPLARITALVSRSNAGILEDNPALDDLAVVDEPGPEHKVLRFARGLSELRAARPDLIINFSAVGALVLRMAGLYHKPLHVEMPLLWWLLGTSSEQYRSRHSIDHYLSALEPVLDGPLPEAERQPRLYLTARDRTGARRLLRMWGLSPADLLVVMHVGGEGFNGRKRWAPQRFAAVGNALVERFNAHVLLIGGKADIPLCEQVAALMPRNAHVVAGQSSLKHTAALIELSALLIGNDSAPLHIAAAVGTPSVGIYGPSNWEQFRPIGKRSYRNRIVHSTLPCSPCFHFIGSEAPWVPNTCYSFACLKSITTDQVLEAAVGLLQDPRDPRERDGG
ncbi:MAG TPA: glycosyltransferase family 9 protein [Ktedonobacterales bacterium]